MGTDKENSTTNIVKDLSHLNLEDCSEFKENSTTNIVKDLSHLNLNDCIESEGGFKFPESLAEELTEKMEEIKNIKKEEKKREMKTEKRIKEYDRKCRELETTLELGNFRKDLEQIIIDNELDVTFKLPSYILRGHVVESLSSLYRTLRTRKVAKDVFKKDYKKQYGGE